MIIKDLKFNLSPNMKINFADDANAYNYTYTLLITPDPTSPWAGAPYYAGGENLETYKVELNTNAPDGTVYIWKQVGIFGDQFTDAADFVNVQTTTITTLSNLQVAWGTAVVINGYATWNLVSKPDRSTQEYPETFGILLYPNANLDPAKYNNLDFPSGSVAQSNYLTVADDSKILPTPTTIEYLIVGGGGGGGGTGWYSGYGGTSAGGGGGGGGVKQGNVTITANVNYKVSVGSGGTGGLGFQDGTNGTGSSIAGSGITTISVSGGGGGAKGAYYAGGSNASTGKNGASGGGGAASGTIRGNGGSGIAGQGYGGGYSGPWSFATWWPSGGGGGAGGGGGIPTSTTPGSGGAGFTSSIKGTAGLYGQGGPGNYSTRTYDARAPGSTGMGGMGGPANTSSNYTVYRAMAGAPGQIVIRYPLTYKEADYTGVVQYTEASGYRIYTFYSTGTISWRGGI